MFENKNAQFTYNWAAIMKDDTGWSLDKSTYMLRNIGSNSTFSCVLCFQALINTWLNKPTAQLLTNHWWGVLVTKSPPKSKRKSRNQFMYKTYFLAHVSYLIWFRKSLKSSDQELNMSISLKNWSHEVAAWRILKFIYRRQSQYN